MFYSAFSWLNGDQKCGHPDTNPSHYPHRLMGGCSWQHKQRVCTTEEEEISVPRPAGQNGTYQEVLIQLSLSLSFSAVKHSSAFSFFSIKIHQHRPSYGVNFNTQGHKVHFYCRSRRDESIPFLSFKLSCVSISLSCVQMMVSEAAKFGVNASLPLVRPVGMSFEEDMRGHNAGGNEEPRADTMVLLTESANPSLKPCSLYFNTNA